MAEYIQITSTTGFKNTVHLNGVYFAPREEGYCQDCHSIGGYCGNCSGYHFAPVVELDECVYCGRVDLINIEVGLWLRII